MLVHGEMLSLAFHFLVEEIKAKFIYNVLFLEHYSIKCSHCHLSSSFKDVKNRPFCLRFYIYNYHKLENPVREQLVRMKAL